MTSQSINKGLTAMLKTNACLPKSRVIVMSMVSPQSHSWIPILMSRHGGYVHGFPNPPGRDAQGQNADLALACTEDVRR